MTRLKSTPSVILLFFLLLGCGRINHDGVIRDIGINPGSGFYLSGVPFFPQNEYMCGPAALASVVGYWGKDAEMKDVAKEVYQEKLKGTLPLDLLIYAKEKGFEAAYYKGSLSDLREKISSGTPLILFLNLGYDFYPVGHYIVVVGYNDRMEAVVAHSGMNREEVFTYRELLGSWEKTNFSTLLVRPKGTR